MISKRNIVKLAAIAAIVLVGVLYWYYAEKRSSPIEEVERTVGTSVVPLPINTSESTVNTNKPKTMKTWPAPTVLPEAERTNKQAVVETNKGTIIFEILPDAPLAASNFITLANGGYYDGLTFHRVVADFVIQGGDPAGTGTGGPGYNFEVEPVKRPYAPGIVAMARTALPNSNGSQFFIVLPGGENKLAPEYTIFGNVTKGMEVVSQIVVGDVMSKVTIEDKK